MQLVGFIFTALFFTFIVLYELFHISQNRILSLSPPLLPSVGPRVVPLSQSPSGNTREKARGELTLSPHLFPCLSLPPFPLHSSLSPLRYSSVIVSESLSLSRRLVSILQVQDPAVTRGTFHLNSLSAKAD